MLCMSRTERQERQDYSATQPSKDAAFDLTATRLLNAEKCSRFASRFAVDVLCQKMKGRFQRKLGAKHIKVPRVPESFEPLLALCVCSSLVPSIFACILASRPGTCCLFLVPALLFHGARRSSSFLDPVGADDALACALVHDAHAADCWLRVAPP